MRVLHIDAFAGISGDMTVSALRDLGVPEEVFLRALGALGIDLPACRFERGERGQVSGWRFLVAGHGGSDDSAAAPHIRDPGHDPQGLGHDHGHHHHDHGHHHHGHGRNHADIVALIEGSRLEAGVIARVLAVFQRIAVAEGGVHGIPPESVHFHEVGAEDSIADIVCACAGLAWLNPDRITCGPLTEGSGHIHCAHGTFPLPAPATLALLRGIPFSQVEEPWEHITPTGAAILAEFSSGFGPMPAMTVSSVGYGLGSRETPGCPNALRLILGESADSPGSDREDVCELRCNLDDLTPELCAASLEALLTAGALDATLTPTLMKKGRPGWILEVLCHPGEADRLEELILRQTTAFGVRRRPMDRKTLERHHRTVQTPYGPVAVKIGMLGGEILQQSPEFSSCAEAAARHGVAVRSVHAAALRALES